MATSRLSLYNGALRECQERKLASLSEDREPRRLLDDVWNDGPGLVRSVLQMKQWTFGRRSVELAASDSVEPSFGFAYAFAQPSDFVRTVKLCTDEYQNSALLAYHIEAGYWYADVDPLYLTYISDHADYGGDLTLWPANFVLFVETHMASLICGRLTGAKANRNDLLKLADIRLNKAANTDAMEQPTQFAPLGRFARARLGNLGLERGVRNRLIG